MFLQRILIFFFKNDINYRLLTKCKMQPLRAVAETNSRQTVCWSSCLIDLLINARFYWSWCGCCSLSMPLPLLRNSNSCLGTHYPEWGGCLTLLSASYWVAKLCTVVGKQRQKEVSQPSTLSSQVSEGGCDSHGSLNPEVERCTLKMTVWRLRGDAVAWSSLASSAPPSDSPDLLLICLAHCCF